MSVSLGLTHKPSFVILLPKKNNILSLIPEPPIEVGKVMVPVSKVGLLATWTGVALLVWWLLELCSSGGAEQVAHRGKNCELGAVRIAREGNATKAAKCFRGVRFFNACEGSESIEGFKSSPRLSLARKRDII